MVNCTVSPSCSVPETAAEQGSRRNFTQKGRFFLCTLQRFKSLGGLFVVVSLPCLV